MSTVKEKEAKLLKMFAEKGVSDDEVRSYGVLCFDYGFVDSKIGDVPLFESYYSKLTEAIDTFDEGMACSSYDKAEEYFRKALIKLGHLALELRTEIRFYHHLSRMEG